MRGQRRLDAERLSNRYHGDRLKLVGQDVLGASGRNAPSRPVAAFGLVGGSPGGPAYPRPWRSGRVSSSRGSRRLEGAGKRRTANFCSLPPAGRYGDAFYGNYRSNISCRFGPLSARSGNLVLRTLARRPSFALFWSVMIAGHRSTPQAREKCSDICQSRVACGVAALSLLVASMVFSA